MLALRLWLQGESGKMSASDENSAIFVRQGRQGAAWRLAAAAARWHAGYFICGSTLACS